jgi:hypothetical protein
MAFPGDLILTWVSFSSYRSVTPARLWHKRRRTTDTPLKWGRGDASRWVKDPPPGIFLGR